MYPKTLDSSQLKIIHGIPPVLTENDRCALDTEWFRMDENRLHRPTGDFACATFCSDGRTVYFVTEPKDLAKAFKNISKAVLIFANAKFDLFHLRRLVDIPDRERVWDVLLIDQIMWSGYYDSFSLADLARRYLHLYVEKETRKEFYQADHMTREMMEYSAIDPVATWRIYQCQKEQIGDTELDLWADIEEPFLWTLLDMPGMPMDKDAWVELYKRNRADAVAIQNRYPEIKLSSNDQVGKEILKQGFKLPKTPTGKPSTVEDDIKIYASKSQFIRDVLEFRGKSKLASTYGEGWVSRDLIEADGKIYSEFRQIGAATGRLSSSNPNVENIPVRETPDFRKCFIASKGKVLIDADWSAQEPRITAYLSEDEKMIQIFKDKQDVYIGAAKLMFNWKLDKKDPRRSGRMKPTVLGACYGLTEYGMEKKYGVPKAEGKKLLDKFFQTFDGIKRWKDAQQRKHDYVETVYGRKYWLNPWKIGSDNNALNSPVQGTASDAMKIAGAKFRKRILDAGYHDRVSIINFIHDEILVEAEKKLEKWAMKNLREVMLEVAESTHPGIPADVEVKSGHSWAECH